MFESDDFDLDEDFLKDIGEKEEQYYSQRNESESSYVEPSHKRYKTENLQFDLSDISFDNEPDFARNTTKSMETNSEELDSAHRLLCKKMLPKVCDTLQSSQLEENVETTRKNMALEILHKGTLEENSEPECLLWTRLSPLQQISLTSERNSQSVDSLREIHKTTSLKMFKIPAATWNKLPAKHTSKDSPKYRSIPRMTLMRKFPGPAGLLPDSHDSNLSHANFLNRLDEHKIDIAEKLDDSGMSEYCSQNTEKLFSVGAWRSMLDDLPADFLNGHEIATIKRWARNNYSSCENSRASFLAGVVQRIDHSVENPRLVLKDLSDSIEATMHRDIPLAHPNILEPGVVILLRNVGLLGFQGSQTCPGLQFHVMIAPKNVLAVYNEKAQLIRSPWMESIVGEASKTLEIPRVSESANSPRNIRENKIHESNPVFADNNMSISDFESYEDETAFGCSNIGAIKDSQVTASFSKTPNIIETKNSRESKSKSKPVKESSMLRTTTKRTNEIEESNRDIEIRPKRMGTPRLKLLQYRSNNVLTPAVADADNPECNDLTEDSRCEEGASNLGTFGDDLLNSDNDTEDEILSQLDVDYIVTSYNSGT